MSKPPRNQHRELIELAALFAAAGIADLFTNVLGHRIEGPSILVALGVIVAAVTSARHLPWRRGTRPTGQSTSTPPLPDHAASLTEPSGRLWRVRTLVEDRPGRLAVLASAFAAVGANILTLQVHPVADGVVDEFLAEAAANVTADQLYAVVAAAGGGQVHVEAADVTSLADVPTRALVLARRLAADPRDLSLALVELLGATAVEWRPSDDESARTDSVENGTESIAIDLSGPRGGVLVISRARVPFTFVELARAQAMADLAGALHAAEVDAASCYLCDQGVAGAAAARHSQDPA